MIKAQKSSKKLFLICFFTYAIVSMTRAAYTASIASIVDEGLFTKSQAGIINAGFYLLYGGAQLVFAKLIDRVSPMAMVSLSIVGALAASVGMAMSKGFYAMLIIWSLSGLVQFAVWPAVVRILAENLLPIHRKKAMGYIAFSYCIGALFNYGSAAVLLSIAGWRLLFWLNTGILVITFAVWHIAAVRTSKYLLEIQKEEKERRKAEKKDIGEDLSGAKAPQISYGKLMIVSGLVVH